MLHSWNAETNFHKRFPISITTNNFSKNIQLRSRVQTYVKYTLYWNAMLAFCISLYTRTPAYISHNIESFSTIHEPIDSFVKTLIVLGRQFFRKSTTIAITAHFCKLDIWVLCNKMQHSFHDIFQIGKKYSTASFFPPFNSWCWSSALSGIQRCTFRTSGYLCSSSSIQRSILSFPRNCMSTHVSKIWGPYRLRFLLDCVVVRKKGFWYWIKPNLECSTAIWKQPIRRQGPKLFGYLEMAVLDGGQQFFCVLHAIISQ